MALFMPPRYSPIDGNGLAMAGAKLTFYQTGTATLQNTYSDSGLTTANTNPVVADSNGLFPVIYLGTTVDYKIVMTTAAGVTVWTVDPYFASIGTARTAVNDTNYQATINDRLIAYIGLSVSRTVTLPSALTYPAGARLVIIDESGGASSTKTISVAPLGTDTINGSNTTYTVITSPYGHLELESGGTTAWAFVSNGPTITVVRDQVFTSSGTYTPHPRMLYCLLECWGPGGGGGGCDTGAANTGAAAAGGGGGSYSYATVSRESIGTSKTVTISAGGTGGAAGNNAGNPGGGDTSIGTLCIGKAGSGGGGSAGSGISVGGAGGVSGTGTNSIVGGNGGNGSAVNQGVVAGGDGGMSRGQGARGPASTTAAGGNAGNPNSGAGGSGGMSYNASGAVAGGAGGSGFAKVTEYCWA